LPATLLLHDNVEVPEPPVIVVAESVQARLVEFDATTRVTVPAKPFTGNTLIVAVPAALVVTLTLEALDVIAKS
jgi:hypothetical protein